MHIDDAVISINFHIIQKFQRIYIGVFFSLNISFQAVDFDIHRVIFFVYSCYHFLVNNSAISSLHD